MWCVVVFCVSCFEVVQQWCLVGWVDIVFDDYLGLFVRCQVVQVGEVLFGDEDVDVVFGVVDVVDYWYYVGNVVVFGD